jgi:hypothetical protein
LKLHRAREPGCHGSIDLQDRGQPNNGQKLTDYLTGSVTVYEKPLAGKAA